MPALPASLALGTIADGSLMVAADERNNFTPIQAAVNALIAALSGGSAGSLLQALSAGSIGYRPDAPIDKNALVWDAATSRWKPQGGALYRKNTAKVVANSAADTDLLNGEITVAAGLLGASGILRLTAWGDWINNTGGVQPYPRFKVKLGAGPTVVLDTNAVGNMSAGAGRFGWRIQAEIQNLGATNSQWSTLKLDGMGGNGVANAATGFATGEGDTANIAVAGGAGLISGVGGGASAIDTTVAMAVQLTVINGSINALYDTTLKGALVEIL